MIRINLLPFRDTRKKENIKRQVLVFVVIFLVIVAAVLWVNRIQRSKIEKLKANIEKTEEDIKKYNAQVEQVDKMTKMLDTLKRKLSVIEDLDRNRVAAFRMLDIFTQTIVEKRMWISRFEAIEKRAPAPVVKGKGKGKPAAAGSASPADAVVEILISGVALDQPTIADFMTKLEDSKFFADIQLDMIQQQKFKQDINLKKFTIKCRRAVFKPPEEKGSEKK